MLCYKDKTYCGFLECGNKDCHRRLTDEVREMAKSWWGNDSPPIMQFTEKPKCFVEQDMRKQK